MTWLEFLSATIGQVVWPVTIAILIWTLRGALGNLLSSPHLTRLKAGPGGVEMDFKRGLGEAKEELESDGRPIESVLDEVQDEGRDFREEMRELAALAPRAVVLESFTRLEALLRHAVDASEVPVGRGRLLSTMRTLSRLATAQGVLTEAESRALNDLITLRNRVAHEPDHAITAADAVVYSDLAFELAISIRRARGETALGQPL